MICSLKEDKDGNFNLNIDGVSHVSWFRRKKEELYKHWECPQGNRIKVLNCKSKIVHDNGMLCHGFFVLL